jgi:porphobilinogen synthase
MELIQRPRRLRTSPQIRRLVKENTLSTNDLVLPVFVKEGTNISNSIPSMPGFMQLSVDKLDKEIAEIASLGVKNIMLFGIPKEKDSLGSISFDDNGFVQKAIRYIKNQLPELIIMVDVCLCEYTSHGHCGIIDDNRKDIDNDKSLPIFAKQAVSYAKAGADIVAPSSMMDGVVLTLRRALDQNNFKNIIILSYSSKYSSSMYGPFRHIAEGAPQFGDRTSYQMDYSNSDEALKEVELDLNQGADIVMVKPAHTYLDVIYKVKDNFPEVPVAAYHTSGEFAMIKAAADKSLLDEEKAIIEVTTSIKRAGADIIVSYFTKDIIKILRKNSEITNTK